MNRRSFLASILKAGAAAAILPSALTYARRWKAARPPEAMAWTVRSLFNEQPSELPRLLGVDVQRDPDTGIYFTVFRWEDGRESVSAIMQVSRGHSEFIKKLLTEK